MTAQQDPGTGEDVIVLDHVNKRFADLGQDDCPFDPLPPRPELARRPHWLRPELVAELEYGEWTGDGRLRHPSYLGLRTDKDAADVTRDP